MANTSTIQAPLPPQSPPNAYSSPSTRFNESRQNSNNFFGARDQIPRSGLKVSRKPVPLPAVTVAEATVGSTPSSPVKVQESSQGLQLYPYSAQVEDHGSQLSAPSSRSVSENYTTWEATPPTAQDRLSPSPRLPSIRHRNGHSDGQADIQLRSSSSSRQTDQEHEGHDARYTPASSRSHSTHNSVDNIQNESETYQPLQYFHQFSSRSSSADQGSRQRTGSIPRRDSSALRPGSARSSGSELGIRGRRRSGVQTPESYARARSAKCSSRSPEVRAQSYADLLNVSYPQAPVLSPENLGNQLIRESVGNHVSLLSTAQTLEMYRANVKKTDDPAIQYEFAVFMVTCAQEANIEEDGSSPFELLKEARQILQRLADRGYPFAQYFLADGYASGLFSRGREDYDKAFSLFVAASKRGHAEAGYRTGLCFEHGWGTRVSAAKAVQFYTQSASKNHPGAMLRMGRACLMGEFGLRDRYKEGVKWMKRAAESADFQYNSAPFELGLLHETGCGDDIFKDEGYAAQLFTKSADLGHMEASYRLGDAYEHGKLTCPRDPALSVHFYNGAAQKGHPMAMMALCAWYLVGADPVLDKDENEAFEWAKKAAEAGLPKAEYCVGYFSEMGIGCRRDPLEANVWYIRAADHGDERAKHRLAAIRAAATGADLEKATTVAAKTGKGDEGRKKKFGIF